jgi:hypothetical protein
MQHLETKGGRDPMMYSWKVSAMLLGAIVVTFVILLNLQPGATGAVIGRTAAAVFDIRFLIIFVVGLVLFSRINPLILAVIVGVAQSVYLQITLQDHWARLDISTPSVFDTFWPAFLGAAILFSLWHTILGARDAGRAQKSI